MQILKKLSQWPSTSGCQVLLDQRIGNHFTNWDHWKVWGKFLTSAGEYPRP